MLYDTNYSEWIIEAQPDNEEISYWMLKHVPCKWETTCHEARSIVGILSWIENHKCAASEMKYWKRDGERSMYHTLINKPEIYVYIPFDCCIEFNEHDNDGNHNLVRFHSTDIPAVKEVIAKWEETNKDA